MPPLILLPPFFQSGAVNVGTPGVHAVWSPTKKNSHITLSSGNLVATASTLNGSSYWLSGLATHGRATGKWYWEYLVTSSSSNALMGLALENLSINAGVNLRGQNAFGFNQSNSISGNMPGVILGSAPNGYSIVNAALGFALDMVNKKLYVSLNGVWHNNSNPSTSNSAGWVASNLSGIVYPAYSVYGNSSIRANFGQSAFRYPVPFGYNPGVF